MAGPSSHSPELDALQFFEDMLIFNKELEDGEKYATFVELRRQFEEEQLLQEMNDDDNTSNQ